MGNTLSILKLPSQQSLRCERYLTEKASIVISKGTPIHNNEPVTIKFHNCRENIDTEELILSFLPSAFISFCPILFGNGGKRVHKNGTIVKIEKRYHYL